MTSIKIELKHDTKPVHLIQKAESIGYFLKDALQPYDDDLQISASGKWGLVPIIEYQMALLAEAENMLEQQEMLKAV